MLQYAKDHRIPIVNINWLEDGGDTKEYELRSMVSKVGGRGGKQERRGNETMGQDSSYRQRTHDLQRYCALNPSFHEVESIFNHRVDKGLIDEWKNIIRIINLEELT